MLKDKLLQDLEEHFETLGQVGNLAQNYDERLFNYLLEESKYKEEFKNRFFIFNKKVLIFKINEFLTFLDLKNLSGSFTSYANKIGLANKTKSLLKTNNEVVLNFAFKDGVIKGGQSKDDETQNEIFFNEILARDEIDVLFDKKALQNFELIGESKNLQEYLKDNPNLLIKGNNLLALHSLKKLYANKVKLIYIDPPYNTGNDSFNYNDKFNHSTWLTFMKNRLEVAREFLRDDGVIFVQCDDNEQAYLKVLMDEIFGRENFVNCIAVKMSETSGVKMAHIDKKLPKLKEYILLFKKQNITLKPQKINKISNIDDFKEYAKYYSNIILNPTESIEKWEICSIKKFLEQNNMNLTDDEILNFKLENADRVIYRTNNKTFDKYNFDTKTREIISPQGKKYIWWEGKQMLFLSDYIEEYIGDLWGDISTINLNKEGCVDFKNAKKPEQLIYRILDMTTNENDLVLDFFAGSGTTLAVAHKMKRRYIGIEQMEYIESITKERLKKVIEGEQGGISKAINWQGGGNFVYAELMPLNAIYKEKIQNLNGEKELDNIYQELKTKAFLDYRVDINEILKDKEFENLDLESKKEILKFVLDSNMDYVLYGDIKDEDYALSKEIIKLNKIFYGDENV
ncbi:site-specific DNA-methyltransferase [Campylobacter coli]|uniref:site-specific DNA-methyltransferase n=1 Tax=Campylobacter coli TaxID=195 RepID=UPI001918D8F8|nr:site-specific DNA-methyltransferase [Campylobacter coli]